MKQWSKENNFQISPTVEFFKKAMEDFVTLTFNPGEVVPTFENADKGMSPLLCMPTSDLQRMRRSRHEAVRRRRP